MMIRCKPFLTEVYMPSLPNSNPGSSGVCGAPAETSALGDGTAGPEDPEDPEALSHLTDQGSNS